MPIRSEVRHLILLPIVVCAIGGGGAFALAASVGERDAGLPRHAAALAERPQTVLPPLPTGHDAAKVVEPVAGASGSTAGAATQPAQAPPTAAPQPHGAASAASDLDLARPSTTGAGTRKATALPNGIALPPLEAPQAVREMIEAGNVIARSPYLWGGGHGRWVDTGYDCSGSVSFVLAAAGFLEAPLASGSLMAWGEPGRGRWVTTYAHQGHVFMEVAGIRFDTSGASQTGSRWQNGSRSTAGFVARHPPGL